MDEALQSKIEPLRAATSRFDKHVADGAASIHQARKISIELCRAIDDLLDDINGAKRKAA